MRAVSHIERDLDDMSDALAYVHDDSLFVAKVALLSGDQARAYRAFRVAEGAAEQWRAMQERQAGASVH